MYVSAHTFKLGQIQVSGSSRSVILTQFQPWLKYQCSITIAVCLLDYFINACTSPRIIHPTDISLATKIYETCHMVLIYHPCCTYLSKAQIPWLPMDIPTCAKLIQEEIGIMEAKNLPYSVACDTPLFNHVHQF